MTEKRGDSRLLRKPSFFDPCQRHQSEIAWGTFAGVEPLFPEFCAGIRESD